MSYLIKPLALLFVIVIFLVLILGPKRLGFKTNQVLIEKQCKRFVYPNNESKNFMCKETFKGESFCTSNNRVLSDCKIYDLMEVEAE